MTINDKVVQAINAQINAELESSYLYLSMALYMNDKGYSGFGSWFFAQHKEEMNHAYEMMQYLQRRGAKPELKEIKNVPNTFGEVLDIFKQTYEHECYISERISEIVHLAVEEKDLATQEFFMKFVAEQVEEEETTQDIVTRLQLAGPHGIYILNKELGDRK